MTNSFSVKVREIKDTRNPLIKQVVFEQIVQRPINNLGSLLNYSMAGNGAFGSNSQTRVAFWNFSPQQIEVLKLTPGAIVLPQLNPRLIVHEFCEGDMIPEEVRSFYKDATYFTPRVWEQDGAEVKQSPKMTPLVEGQEQQILCYNDSPIYRNTFFTMGDMVQEDLLIAHNNVILGTTNSIKVAAIIDISLG